MGHFKVCHQQNNMFALKQVSLMALLIALAYAAPQSPEESEDYINPNPTYNYAYQVSDDESQTYIAHQEGREDNVVTGEYSYVDPFGALITVTYIADSNGYREERKSQPNFVQIRALPVARTVIPQPAPKPAPVRRVVVAKPAPAPVRRIVPAAPVRTVVPARTAPAVVPAPIVREVVDVEKVANIFGTGGSNNVKVETPDFNFAFDL